VKILRGDERAWWESTVFTGGILVKKPPHFRSVLKVSNYPL
jgi:hypothetical protein